MLDGPEYDKWLCQERVMVSFYPVDTDNTSNSSARTLAIHKEKSYVPLRGNKQKDLFNFVKDLKTITE